MKNRSNPDDTMALARALRSLGGGRAPASLAPAVLRRVGLVDRYWRVASPVGSVFVARGPRGISLLLRTESAARFEREFRRRHGRAAFPAESPAPREIRAAVERCQAATGEAARVDLQGLTDFECAVLHKAAEIPRGEVRPYGWIAREIGRPGAVRAVGTALAHNPVPLLIPCHRVVRSDGTVGDYVFGETAKKTLLESEGARPAAIERLAASGTRYLGNEEGRFFCFPTCGGIETLLRDNAVPFRTARAALAAGYHPCETCRPAALAS
ncbi:MAG: methylated-DNA--[protein]-cysteine S-methyltransferase [Acidobacteriota bacterium]